MDHLDQLNREEGFAEVMAPGAAGDQSICVMRPGHLFVFEGPDGVGKSSLSTAVAEALSAEGYTISVQSFPGRGAGSLGAHVYALHHNPVRFGISRLAPVGLQLLHIAAHLDAIDHEVRPHIDAGEIVLLDRYWWSTWVYGATAGVRRDLLHAMIELERRYWFDLQPDIIFLLHRSESLRAEEPADSFVVRSAQYALLAEHEMDDAPVIRVDNGGSMEEAAKMILQEIRQRIGRSRPLSAPLEMSEHA